MLCSRFNKSIENFCKESIYCKYCGGNACWNHLLTAKPKKYNGLTLDNVTLS